MPSSKNRERKHGAGPSNKIVTTTIIIAFALIAGLGSVLLLTSGSNSASSDITLAASSPLPAPRPITKAAVDTARHTPEVSGQSGDPTIAVGTKRGQLALDFTLATLDGSEKSLSDFRGQVVLVNFWASWCGPCRIEFPALKSIYEKYKDKGFTIVAVNLGEKPQTAAEFAKQFELPFTVMLDTNAGVARIYGAYSIPTSYFLDRQGVIRELRAGAMPENYVETIVAQLLDQS